MRVSWEDDKKIQLSTAFVGFCYLAISWPSWYSNKFRVAIKVAANNEERALDEETTWVRYEVPTDNILGDSEYRKLQNLKDLVVQKARELGCKRAYKKTDWDEDWLTALREDMLKTIHRRHEHYQNLLAYFHKNHIYPEPKFTEGATQTSWFVSEYSPDEAGHYLGRDYTHKQIQRAVGLVLDRLEREGVIESISIDRKHRYWVLKKS